MKAPNLPAIYGLHHNAWRCSDAERSRRFYEDLLGLPLTDAFEIRESKTGREVQALHLFFALADGSSLAFFDVPGMPFEFKAQHDFDLHIALAVDTDALQPMIDRARAIGVEVRGISHHGRMRSIYLRDPDGYVVELAAPVEEVAALVPTADARKTLDAWQQRKSETHRLQT